MPINQNIRPKSRARHPRHVCALLYDGLCTFEFAIAAEIFGLPRPDFGDDWYSFTTVSEDNGPVRANVGITIEPNAEWRAIESAGTILLPGWRTENEQPSEKVQDAILRAHELGARLISICSGSFLLAAMGLLDGRRATTHWLYADKMADRYAQVHVDPNVLFVDEGTILTSAGSAAGVDLLLHIIRKDFGAERANIVARRLVMPAHREGDQRQFVSAPVATSKTDRLRPILDKVRLHPCEDWTIDRLASEALMSRRTFIRRFREATGQAPAVFVTDVRLSIARDALEETSANIADIASSSGFGSVATMTHHFKKVLGSTPSAYRRRFRKSL